MYKLVPLAGIVGWIAFGDWLAGLSLAVLALCWVMLPAEEGPPVLALAVTMQWVSVSIGFFYNVITGRPLDATLHVDPRKMVALGLGCVTAMILGLSVARYLISRMKPPQGLRPAHALTFKTLVLVYALWTIVLAAMRVTDIDFGGLQLAVLAMTYLRLGLLYLVFRRLVANGTWYLVAALLGVEIILGITGFYAGFREPIVMAALAFLEFFDRRSVKQWVSIGTLGAVAVSLGIIWVGVRADYRARYLDDERFSASRSARVDLLKGSVNTFTAQSSEDIWDNIDRFIDRMWTIYYPALAVDRVPSVMAHTNGQLMGDTLRFVFLPRLLFPDKPYIKSDSEMVRKYAGVMVAGEEQNTSIAFGYAAESYIDFGVPGMFVPSFVWALFIGIACALISREYRHRDMAISVTTVIGWLSLYLFERSWATIIGLGGTMLIYAGGLCYVLDRLWFEKFRNAYVESEPDDDGESADDAPPLHLHPQPHSK